MHELEVNGFIYSWHYPPVVRSLSKVISVSFEANNASKSGGEADDCPCLERPCLELGVGQQDVDFINEKNGILKLVLVDLG